MRKRVLSSILIFTFALSLLAGCGSTGETVETETEEVVEESETVYPTEDDIEIFTTGIEDYYVLQGTTSFTVTDLIQADSDIIDGIYVDTSVVDFDTVGEYEVTYKVFFNEENFTAYTEDTESYEVDFVDVVVLDENGNVIEEESIDTESTDDTDIESADTDEESVYNDNYIVSTIKSYIIVTDEESTTTLVEENTPVYTDNNAVYNGVETENTEDVVSDDDTITSSSTTSSSSSTSSKSSSNTTTTCDHNWVAQTVHHDATGHYESVCVQAAYDETIQTGSESHWFCRSCGIDMTAAGMTEEQQIAHEYNHMANGTSAGSYSTLVVTTSTVHHDAVYQDQWVEDSAAYDEVTGYVCSICGATK